MTVYATILGDSLHSLPPACRALHEEYGKRQGKITVQTSGKPLLRAFLRLSGLPDAVSDADFTLTTERCSSRDIWTREIGTDVTRSTLWSTADGALYERMGPALARSRVIADTTGIQLQLVRISMLGLPMPLSLAPQVTTHEAQENGRYTFDVQIRLPLTKGLLIRYQGWLKTL